MDMIETNKRIGTNIIDLIEEYNKRNKRQKMNHYKHNGKGKTSIKTNKN